MSNPVGWRFALAVALTASLVNIAHPQTASERSTAPEGKQANADQDLLHALKKRRVIAAQINLDVASARFEAGTAIEPEIVCQAIADLANARCDIAESAAARVEIKADVVRYAFKAEDAMMRFDLADRDHSKYGHERFRSMRIKAQADLVEECIAAKVAPPKWPVLPIGTDDAEIAGMLDDLGGEYTVTGLWEKTEASHAIDTIRLRGEQITDETVLKLKKLSDLKTLVLIDAKVTATGITALKKELPNLDVTLSVAPQPSR